MPVLLDTRSHRIGARQGAERIEIGLVNNMPDGALEPTERQFVRLIGAAAGDIPVRLSLFALPGIPRGERAERHVARTYHGLRELRESRLDALIVTGTEPRAAALTDEPYWPALAELIDWAERNTVSSLWSCLAAHAAVLRLDGVARHARKEKCFGVFDCAPVSDHPLAAGLPAQSPVPHARWNELRENELRARGYEVLTRSAQAGVDAFIKQGRSLFVLLQGHPEYDAASLLGEFRRDLARYLRGDRVECPTIPHGYFDTPAGSALARFCAHARADRREELLAEFPLAAVERGVRGGWQPAAQQLYRNWLAWIWAHKAQSLRFSPALISAATQPMRVSVPFAARPAAAANDRAPAVVPFVERRRRSDPSGFFSGARDRRTAAQPGRSAP